jgi:hypothetical protein
MLCQVAKWQHRQQRFVVGEHAQVIEKDAQRSETGAYVFRPRADVA